jgi:hypothetical protein
MPEQVDDIAKRMVEVTAFLKVGEGRREREVISSLQQVAGSMMKVVDVLSDLISSQRRKERLSSR